MECEEASSAIAPAIEQLWRPNSLVLVDDLYSDVLEERLIGALSYVYGDEGALTKMRVVR